MIKKILIITLLILSVYTLFGIKYIQTMKRLITERMEKIEQVEKALFNEGS